MGSAILAQSTPTLAVALIYCLWFRAYMSSRLRDQRLRERVAYMLWAAADETD
jgi:hypothetical protein